MNLLLTILLALQPFIVVVDRHETPFLHCAELYRDGETLYVLDCVRCSDGSPVRVYRLEADDGAYWTEPSVTYLPVVSFREVPLISAPPYPEGVQ